MPPLHSKEASAHAERKLLTQLWKGDRSWVTTGVPLRKPEDWSKFYAWLHTNASRLQQGLDWLWLTAPVRKINAKASTVTFRVKSEPSDEEPDNGFGRNGFGNETVEKTVVLKTDSRSETDDLGAHDANEDKSPSSSSKNQSRGAPSGPDRQSLSDEELWLAQQRAGRDEGDDDQSPEGCLDRDAEKIVHIDRTKLSEQGFELIGRQDVLKIPARERRLDQELMCVFIFTEEMQEEPPQHKLARVVLWDLIVKAVEGGPYETIILNCKVKHDISDILRQLQSICCSELSHHEHGMSIATAGFMCYSIDKSESIEKWYNRCLQAFKDIDAVTRNMKPRTLPLLGTEMLDLYLVLIAGQRGHEKEIFRVAQRNPLIPVSELLAEIRKTAKNAQVLKTSREFAARTGLGTSNANASRPPQPQRKPAVGDANQASRQKPEKPTRPRGGG